MANIVFTRVSGVRVKITDGAKVVAGLSVYTNVFEHPILDAVILSNDCDVINTMNSSCNGLIINVSDVATPASDDKTDLAEQLISNYFS